MIGEKSLENRSVVVLTTTNVEAHGIEKWWPYDLEMKMVMLKSNK